MSPTEGRFRRTPSAVDAVVDGQTVLLSPLDFSYHSLDPVGARIWELLAEPLTMDELVEVLSGEYEVAPEQCRGDVSPFIERMVAIGAVDRGE
jgi:Coenzyme PQQ synthesis protein D (PqqD)